MLDAAPPRQGRQGQAAKGRFGAPIGGKYNRTIHRDDDAPEATVSPTSLVIEEEDTGDVRTGTAALTTAVIRERDDPMACLTPHSADDSHRPVAVGRGGGFSLGRSALPARCARGKGGTPSREDGRPEIPRDRLGKSVVPGVGRHARPWHALIVVKSGCEMLTKIGEKKSGESGRV